MGNLQAREMAEHNPSLSSALTWQLRANFYPPHPIEMVQVAIDAVMTCNEGDHERLISSPYEHKTHGLLIPAYVVVNAFKLHPWVTWED